MLRTGALLSLPRAIGYWTGIAGQRLRCNGYARILSFHGTPRDQARELERQLRYLKRQFEVVPLDTLIAAVAAGSPEPGWRVALTFDDGIRSNVQVAYPLLKRLHLPATFFVCPGLVERGAWLWNMEARYRLLSLSSGQFAELAREWNAPSEVEPFVEWMKTLRLDSRCAVEARIKEASRAFIPTQAQREQCELAGWDELERMDPRVVTLGSHTLTHPILVGLTLDELEAEIAGSRAAAESRLQRSVDLFAYPNGDQNELVRDCVRKHYRAAVTTAPMWVPPRCDPFLLPRVGTPRGAVRLCWNMHLPAYLPCAS